MLKKAFLIPLALLCIFFTIISCTNSKSNTKRSPLKDWMSNNGKIKVLCTTAMINDLVKIVGTSHIETTILIQGDLNPHTYELVKGDNEKLLRADIIFCNGLGLEHSPSLSSYLKENSKAVLLGDKIHFNFPEKILWVDSLPDPHIWMDVSLWAMTLDSIEDTLATIDPENADEYHSNASILRSEMLSVDNKMRDLLQEIEEKNRYLVTSHDAFNYFTKRYLATEEEEKGNRWQERFKAPEGLSPDCLLSTTDIRNIIKHLQRYDINILFVESNVSRDSINKILSAGSHMGLSLNISEEALYADAMGPSGSTGDTYLKMVLHNARVIASSLGKGK